MLAPLVDFGSSVLEPLDFFTRKLDNCYIDIMKESQ
jgi:hypothetical protein